MSNYIKLNRAVIELSGQDAKKLLQSIISNDINILDKEKSIHTFLLTPQGKYLFDFFIINKSPEINENNFLIDIDAKDKDSLLKKLKMYKLRSDVLILDISSDYFVISSQQPLALGVEYLDSRNKNMGIRTICKLGQDLSAFNKLDYVEYINLRISNLVPESEDFIKEKSYPLQFRMIENNSVDFNKGCYVGQEVTARTHHRGAVKKTIFKIQASDLNKGEKVLVQDMEVGLVLSASSGIAIAHLDIQTVKDSIKSEKLQTNQGKKITLLKQ